MAYLKSVCLVAISFLIGMLLTAFVEWPPQQSSDWASWMQAVGSIVGIGIAIALPAYQQFQTRKESRNAAAASLRAAAEVVALLMRAAAGAVTDIRESFEREGLQVVQFIVQNFEELSEILTKVEVHRLPTPGAVEAMVDARAATKDLLQAIRAAENEMNSHLFVLDKTEAAINTAYIKLVTTFNRLVGECSEIEQGHNRWSATIEARRETSRTAD